MFSNKKPTTQTTQHFSEIFLDKTHAYCGYCLWQGDRGAKVRDANRRNREEVLLPFPPFIVAFINAVFFGSTYAIHLR